jgi:hypothetical protein
MPLRHGSEVLGILRRGGHPRDHGEDLLPLMGEDPLQGEGECLCGGQGRDGRCEGIQGACGRRITKVERLVVEQLVHGHGGCAGAESEHCCLLHQSVRVQKRNASCVSCPRRKI